MSLSLAILGPGTLGQSTAQWAAECGLETRLLGRDQGHAEGAVRAVRNRWERSLAAGRMTPEAARLAGDHLRAGVFESPELQPPSILLEALPEDPELKAQALAAAARWGGEDLLLLSGTSAIPISHLARLAGLGERLVGFHLFVPVPRMAVVEVAVAPHTPQAWVDRAHALGQTLRKRVVQVRDQPGFAAARMALAQGLEAMRLLEAGVASAEDLDALMVLGYGHPIGPLELSDRVGLDLRLRIAQGLAEAGEHRFSPPPVLQAKVASGATGAHDGRGFFDWDNQGRRL
jgi:3-hydroxybutyryl-CoA dehydrogenase